MNERNIEIVREYNFDPKEVVAGLNGYYESDKHNGYITIMRNDLEGPAYLTTALYLSALIEWLREDFNIFYRPGLTLDQVEAARSAAKMCCLRAHIKDEICKRGLWCDKDADIPELVDIVFRAYDEEGADLKKRAMEIKEVNDKRWKDLRDINKALGYDGMDGHVDDFAKAVKARAECAKMALGEESDINALIRDYCTKNDIIAPSRYFSEKACVEYLFSVIDLKQKDRSFTILQDLYRDIFKKQPDGLSAEDIANKILDKVLETEDLLHKSVDSVNKECKAVGKQMVADYEKDLLKFIYKEYKDRTRLSDKIITYNPPSVRNTVLKIISDYASCRNAMDILETQIKSIYDKYKTDFTVDGYVINGDPTSSFMLSGINSFITMATLDRSNIALRDIYTTVASPVERRRYNIDDCDGAIVDHMKDYILRRFEGLRINTEYCLKKMSELDGCQKDLKTLEEQRDEFMKQNAILAIKVDAKDDEISRLKDLINAMNEEVKDM